MKLTTICMLVLAATCMVGVVAADGEGTEQIWTSYAWLEYSIRDYDNEFAFTLSNNTYSYGDDHYPAWMWQYGWIDQGNLGNETTCWWTEINPGDYLMHNHPAQDDRIANLSTTGYPYCDTCTASAYQVATIAASNNWGVRWAVYPQFTQDATTWYFWHDRFSSDVFSSNTPPGHPVFETWDRCHDLNGDYKFEDLNGDGYATQEDIKIFFYYYDDVNAGGWVDPYPIDYDNDGAADYDDLFVLYNYVY